MDFPDKPGDGSEISPLNLSDLKLRLLHGEPGQNAAHAEVIREIIALGDAASSLLPVIVQQYRAEKLKGVAASSLLEPYLQSRHQELLDVLRERGVFRSFNAHEKCALLEAGVLELESELVCSLWQVWGSASNPQRVQVVKTFGRAGGPKALEVLKVIRYKMAGHIPEEKARSSGANDDDSADLDALRRRIDTDGDEAFLQEVRTAISQMEERGIK